MKKSIPLFVLMTIVVFAVGACGRPTPVPTEQLPPTEAPTEPLPTKAPAAAPAPTDTPSPTVAAVPTETPAPTEMPAEEFPEPTEVSVQPPTNPSLGDTWTRPADEMAMVYVPTGEFEMGSTAGNIDEQPVHTVALDGFWIDRTEVANAQYLRCVEAGGCEAPGRGNYEFKDPARTDHPKVSVEWSEAEAYCEWAGARLPTEAEWEYAARGPDRREYPWGDEFEGARLNYCDANCPAWSTEQTGSMPDETVDDSYEETAPAGNYPDGASWCGPLDMAGNVGEWVADWHGEYPAERQENPTGPTSGEGRVLRGGSFIGPPNFVRGACRFGTLFPSSSFIGFRCARDTD